MTKDELRLLKSHYGVRWAAFHYNRKHTDKIMPLEEKIVTNSFLPGKVLAHNCLGQLYQSMFDVVTDPEPCSTIALINPLEFKYKAPRQIVEQILAYRPYLLPKGRIIVNVNLQFLVYHRLCISQQSVSNIFKDLLSAAGFDVVVRLLPVDRVSYGYGQLFLILNQRD